MVEQATATIVSTDDRADNLSVFFRNQEQIRIAGKHFLYFSWRIGASQPYTLVHGSPQGLHLRIVIGKAKFANLHGQEWLRFRSRMVNKSSGI